LEINKGTNDMVIAFLAGFVLGMGLLYWRTTHLAHQRRRIPKVWPLTARPLVNHRERQVWKWLHMVVDDQRVLVKLPVTRFTIPAEPQNARHWYRLLNSVYCTFTVCAPDGKVIGCVDVPGPDGLSMSNQSLKHSLLSQCGVNYWVVDASNLPEVEEMRVALLGVHAVKRTDPRDYLDSRFKDVRDNLKAAVSKRRDSKSSNFAHLDATLAKTTDSQESRLPSGWEHNSFVTPLDSRLGGLEASRTLQ
jgi:hypothetical protein